MPKTKLSKSMTMSEFDNGYWYASDLKKFGQLLQIPGANKLRKDELEKAIKVFLQNGTIKSPTNCALSKSGPKDLERGLSLDLPIANYTSNRETKDFIYKEARKKSPKLKKKSGVGYRLNRWREEQLTIGIKITYGDLINQFIRMNEGDEPFARVPHVRYINFISDFMASEENATRENAMKAWDKLKKLDIPKDYRSWVKFHRKG